MGVRRHVEHATGWLVLRGKRNATLQGVRLTSKPRLLLLGASLLNNSSKQKREIPTDVGSVVMANRPMRPFAAVVGLIESTFLFASATEVP